MFYEIFTCNWLKQLQFRCLCTLSYNSSRYKRGNMTHFENNLDFSGNLWNVTLISKRQFLPWNQGWFQGNLNLSQVHNVHNVSVVSSEEGVHIIISNDSLEQFSWMILLNNSFKRLSCCAIGVLQVPVFYEKLLWYLFSYLRFILLVIRIWTR